MKTIGWMWQSKFHMILCAMCFFLHEEILIHMWQCLFLMWQFSVTCGNSFVKLSRSHVTLSNFYIKSLFHMERKAKCMWKCWIHMWWSKFHMILCATCETCERFHYNFPPKKAETSVKTSSSHVNICCHVKIKCVKMLN